MYTSCKKGVSTGSGFQTYSLSKGITDEEKTEIERNGVYILPDQFQLETRMESADQYPVSFSFYQLKSKRYVISQSKYIGKDYSGRRGNYFCHALVLEDGNWPFYPIQLYHSPSFKDRLTEAEMNTDETPPPLEPLNIDDLALNDSLDFEIVSDFIQDDRLEYVTQMVQSVIDYEKSHRRLILCDREEYIPFWFGAIQMAFPVRLSHYFTFSTYSYDPENTSFLACAAPQEGTRFEFTEDQRTYKYFVFDFCKGTHSDVESRNKYTQIVEIGYAISKENLDVYHSFIDRFNYHRINAEIDRALDLFTMTSSDIADMSYDDIVSAIEFANAYASKEVLGNLLENMGRIVEELSTQVNFQSADILTRFQFNIGRATNNPAHIDNAYAFLFNAVDHLILDHPDLEKHDVIAFNNTFLELNKSHPEEFIEQMMASARLENLNLMLSDDDVIEHTELYFIMMLNNLINLGCSWEKAMGYDGFAHFLNTCFSRLIRHQSHMIQALSAVNRDPAFFSHMIVFCIRHHMGSDPHVQRNFIEGFNKALKPKNTEWAFGVRSKIIEFGFGDFIFEDFKILLNQAKDKPYFFWLYYTALFSKLPGYRTDHFSQAVNVYLSFLETSRKSVETIRLLDVYEEIKDKTVLAKVIKLVEDEIPLTSPSDATVDLVNKLLEIKGKRKIVTSPDISGLCLIGNTVELKAFESLPQLFRNKPPLLEGLERKRYKDFLKWIFPDLILQAKEPKDHHIVLNNLPAQDLEDVMLSAYASSLSKILKDKEGIEIFIDFLIYYFTAMKKDEHPSIIKIRQFMWNELTSIVSKLSESKNNYISGSISKRCRKKEISENWVALRKEAEERYKKSLIGRFKNRFLKKKPSAEE